MAGKKRIRRRRSKKGTENKFLELTRFSFALDDFLLFLILFVLFFLVFFLFSSCFSAFFETGFFYSFSHFLKDFFFIEFQFFEKLELDFWFFFSPWWIERIDEGGRARKLFATSSFPCAERKKMKERSFSSRRENKFLRAFIFINLLIKSFKSVFGFNVVFEPGFYDFIFISVLSLIPHLVIIGNKKWFSSFSSSSSSSSLHQFSVFFFSFEEREDKRNKKM